jgi:acetyl-CoA carboxylase biotin carboxyl carrier protein
MMGIFYACPSPGSPPFVKPGDSVSAGEVVGLIEAMKVFNEIVSPFSGKVALTPAENGQLVQPGDLLLLID